MFLVSGGDDGQYAAAFDSTETFDPLVGTWATSGAKLPRPMAGARGIIINDRLLIFGNYIQCVSRNRESGTGLL